MTKDCPTCGKPFQVTIHRKVYCSIPCHKNKYVVNPDLFWEKVNKAAPNGCWEWTGYRQKFGHGSLARTEPGQKPKYVLAHRHAWELLVGPIPEGACLLHKCDNPPCVNPDHCYIGDRLANARDKIARGRHAVGEATKCAVLNDEKVRLIRKLRAEGMGYTAIGRQIGHKWGCVRDVCIGKFWRHVQ
jgi:hypothetical protein